MDRAALKMAGVEIDKPPMFKNNCGRTLSSHAVIYIAEGEGYFEDAHTKRHEVKTGSIFYLYPNRWHNFDPKPGTVWTECWALFDGAKAEELFGEILPKGLPIRNLEPSKPLFDAYRRLCELRSCKGRFAGEQSLFLLHFILIDAFLRMNGILDEANESAVEKAKDAIRLAAESKSSFDFKRFAEREGLGYEKLRKQFAKETGLSPLNYLMELRMEKAVEMLIQPNSTVKEIAVSLGFEDPYYFSRLFKRRKGSSPEAFRKTLLLKP